eukprot:gene12194-2224_t
MPTTLAHVEGLVSELPNPDGRGLRVIPTAGHVASLAMAASREIRAGPQSTPFLVMRLPLHPQKPKGQVVRHALYAGIPESDFWSSGWQAATSCAQVHLLAPVDLAEPPQRPALSAQPLRSPAEKLELFVPPGHATAATRTYIIIPPIVQRVDNDRVKDHLDHLSGAKPAIINGREVTIATRWSWGQGNADAAEYIANFFSEVIKCDEVNEQVFSGTGGTSKNIICVLKGTSSDIVVVGAHFDSTSERAQTLAPGAVDNGSGSVSVMEAAEALMALSNIEKTVHFVVFSGEEQGLIGSKYYVDQAKANGLNIVAGLILDMTAYSNRYFGVTIEGTTNTAVQELMEECSLNVDWM